MSNSTQTNKYLLFQSVRSLEFFSPVIVLFWLSHGLNMTQVMLLQSIYSIGVLILEIPSGAVADYFGKRISLIIGSFIFGLGFILYGFGSSFLQFAIGELVVALGMSLISGVDSAFIHEHLKENDKENQFNAVEGKASSFMQVGRMISSVVGGFIGSVSLGFSLIATGIASIAGSAVALTFTKTSENLDRNENTNYIQIISESLSLIKNNKSLVWITVLYAFFQAILFSIIFLIQPYMLASGVPTEFFGVVFAGCNLLSAIVLFRVDSLQKLFGSKQNMYLIAITSVALVGLGSILSPVAIPLWAVIFTAMSVSRILINRQVLAIIPSNRSATVLSFLNMSRRVVLAVLAPVVGIVSDVFGILWALRFVAALFIAVFLLLKLLRGKRRIAVLS